MRQVKLPETILGRLYLHSTPGRRETIEEFLADAAGNQIDRVVCLVPADDIRRDAPDYDRLLSGRLPWEHVRFPIPDFGVPADPDAFRSLAGDTAAALQSGKNVLIHCGAGIGRTGTLATAVLLALGIAIEDARQMLRPTGSHPETDEQQELVTRLARRTG